MPLSMTALVVAVIVGECVVFATTSDDGRAMLPAGCYF
ncbi:MAG: hypothetical protein GPOALKHO_000770 [Sodalis sp.]|nr:MAG: hypothetical protein GPOALKHO_000770 [Sodalis sp.]